VGTDGVFKTPFEEEKIEIEMRESVARMRKLSR